MQFSCLFATELTIYFIYCCFQLSLKNILQPAIDLAKEGFPVHPVAAYFWDKCGSCLQVPTNKHGCDMLLNGHPPKAGDVMVMPHLAATFEVTFSHKPY